MIHDVIINGVAQSGKDTFVSLFEDSFNDYFHIFNISSIDPFRTIPYEWGWNGVKDDNYRAALSYLKKAATYIADYPIREMLDKRRYFNRRNGKPNVFFYHIREPEEIEKFKRALDIDLLTVLVRREVRTIPEHSTDRLVFDYRYDVVIENNSGKDKLVAEAHNLLYTHMGYIDE